MVLPIIRTQSKSKTIRHAVFETSTTIIDIKLKRFHGRIFVLSWRSQKFSQELFRMGGGGVRQKKAPYQFFPCNFYKRKNYPPKAFHSQFQPFCHIGVKFQVCTQCQSQVIELNEDHPSKKWFSWSNLYKIEVMITSLIEMLELPIFDNMTTPTI